MKQRQGQKGFTLIELMIVVAVIGVLSAIAIPKYQDFAKKGAVASGIATLSALKTNVEDYMASNGSFPTKTEAGAIDPSIGSITFTAAGTGTSGAAASIKLDYTDSAVNGLALKMSRESDGEWDCSYSTGTSDITTDLGIVGCSYL